MSIWNKEKDRPNYWTIVLYGFLALLVLWGLAIAVWGFRVGTAGIFGAGEARIQIQSADFRIAAQAGFFDDCASIQGHEFQIDSLNLTLAEELSQRTRELTLTQLNGVRAVRLRAIAQYNADAENTYLEGQFRDADLPFKIPSTAYPEEGVSTVCSAAR